MAVITSEGCEPCDAAVVRSVRNCSSVPPLRSETTTTRAAGRCTALHREAHDTGTHLVGTDLGSGPVTLQIHPHMLIGVVTAVVGAGRRAKHTNRTDGQD